MNTNLNEAFSDYLKAENISEEDLSSSQEAFLKTAFCHGMLFYRNFQIDVSSKDLDSNDILRELLKVDDQLQDQLGTKCKFIEKFQ